MNFRLWSLFLLILPLSLLGDNADPDFGAMQHNAVTFIPGKLEKVVVEDPVDSPTPYWVMPYKLVNETGISRDMGMRLFLQIDVKDLDGNPKRYYAIDQGEVHSNYENRAGRRYLTHAQMQGKLLRNQVKEGLAVFPSVDPHTDKIDVYVVGLSPAKRRVRTGDELRKLVSDRIHLREAERTEDFEERYLPTLKRISREEFDRLKREGRESEVFQFVEMDAEPPEYIRYYKLNHLFFQVLRAPFRERWILVMRFTRQGDAFQTEMDMVRSRGHRWLLAVEKLEE